MRWFKFNIHTFIFIVQPRRTSTFPLIKMRRFCLFYGYSTVEFYYARYKHGTVLIVPHYPLNKQGACVQLIALSRAVVATTTAAAHFIITKPSLAPQKPFLSRIILFNTPTPFPPRIYTEGWTVWFIVWLLRELSMAELRAVSVDYAPVARAIVQTVNTRCIEMRQFWCKIIHRRR